MQPWVSVPGPAAVAGAEPALPDLAAKARSLAPATAFRRTTELDDEAAAAAARTARSWIELRWW